MQRRPEPIKLLRALLHGALLASLTTPAWALRVEIDAPKALQASLRQHLDAARAARLAEGEGQGTTPLAGDELARLEAASLVTARELLATEGYFSPGLESRRTALGDDWLLAFKVVPGARTQVRTLALELAGDFADAPAAARLRERVREAVTLAPGMPFRQADWDAAKSAALRPFGGGAYAAARIAKSEARIDPAAGRADLTIVVDSGPPFRLGAIEIEGANRYPESVARHFSPLKAGARLRQQDLLDYQTALEASGYYAQATVRVEPDPDRADAVPVEVEVVERPTQLASAGVGISTDTGARVQGEYQHRNLDRRGLRLELDARLETRQQQTGARIAWPRTASGYDYGLALRQRADDIEGQETRATTLGARRERTRGQISTALVAQYQTETRQLADQPQTRSQALTLGYQWTQRTVGRAFYPGRGYVLSAGVGGALDGLLSDTRFVRLHARHTQFLRAGEQGRWVLRGELGAVLADTRLGIPSDFLFRAGGDNSVRGYAYQSLGLALDGAVESVRYLATASAEYQYFFSDAWGAALFVDAGDAADSPSALDPVVGVGVGARYRSPVGPINLDLAWGEAVEKFRVHFSLGVTF